MKRYYIAAVVLGIGVAVSAARASDLSRYSSRAALIGHGREVTVAVLPGTPPSVAASTEGHAVAVENLSSKKALLPK